MQDTMTRPNLGERRTLNASAASLPYEKSAAYRPELQVTANPADVFQLNARLSRMSCDSPGNVEELRSTLIDITGIDIDFAQFDEIVERWREIQVSTEGAAALDDMSAAMRQRGTLDSQTMDNISGVLALVFVAIIVVVI